MYYDNGDGTYTLPKAGEWVRVWIGAFTGQHGIPPEDTGDWLICEVQWNNEVGQVYVWPRLTREDGLPAARGKFVWLSAILGPLTPAETAATKARYAAALAGADR